MKYSECEVGEYYNFIPPTDTNQYWVIKVGKIDSEGIEGDSLSILRYKGFHKNAIFFKDMGAAGEFYPASEEEIAWLDACIAADKIVIKPELQTDKVKENYDIF